MGTINAMPALTAQAIDEIPCNRPPATDGKITAGDIVALAGGPLSWSAQGTNVSVTTTAEIQLATVTFTARADRKYLIVATAHLTKDTGTTARAATLRLRRGTDNNGTLLATGAGASAGIASSPFGASVLAVHVPGAGAGTYRLSAVNFASASVVAAQANLAVVELAV